ncbi:hypothetical protein [Acidiphilium sp.]|uniref:hypothetical protein n=1 Tax=Acidiphilium sp. TaxID=527 RepID=UPI003D081046
MTNQTIIRVRYSSIDGASRARTFTTIEAARTFAHHWVGKTPEMGGRYAISGDGIGKIEVRGTTLDILFPEAV